MTVVRHCALVLVALIPLGCQAPLPRLDKTVLGRNQIEPVWSMGVGCVGGLRVEGRRLIVYARSLGEYEPWTLDIASGRLLEDSDKPVKNHGSLEDTRVDVTGGVVKALRHPEAAHIAPPGFEPVVLTDRFLFAKRTRLRLRSWHFFREGQVIVIDRSTREPVWVQEGIDATIQVSSTSVFVCDNDLTSAFAFTAGRPTEVSAFYAAIRSGNLVEVRRLYAAWRKTGLFDLGGLVPLSVAAKKGRLPVVELLLSLGESPNDLDANGHVPLLMALKWDHPDVATRLLDAGADPNYESHLWGSPLEEAVHSGKRPILEHLLEKGAKIDARVLWSGGTALHEAVMYRNYEAIETLIGAGADVRILDNDRLTPPQHAPDDACVAHVLAGGKIADKPEICRPPKRE